MQANKQEWEKAEIKRSTIEALNTPDEQLVANDTQLARYLNPPPHTVYPLEYAFALLGDVRNRTVLDFGCGSGENSLVLARRGARVIGVDISESLLRRARRRLEINGLIRDATFIAGSAHDLPVRDGSVDVVLGIAILHHLNLDDSSREVHRVLKSGGRAIFQEPVRDSRLIRAVRRLIPYRAPDVSPFERPLTTRELERFSTGFSSCSVRAFWLPFVNVISAIPPLHGYVSAAHEWDGAILGRMPALRPFAGIRVFEVTK